MGLFGGNKENTRRNPDAAFGFRALAGGYILYMLYEMIRMYANGESNDLVALIIGIVVLGGGGLFVLISSYISWRREKAKLEEEQRREALEQTEEEETDEVTEETAEESAEKE